MFFSKIWFLVVALAAALAFGGALVVPKPGMREINKAKAAGLDRIQHNADLLLRLGAREWLDAATGISQDRKLVEVLEQASDRRGEMDQHKARATDRLLTLTNKLPSDRRPELLIAVDARGKQISRIGPGDVRFKPGVDGIAGYPLVEAVLRGYSRDDTWNIDGKLYLMVGSTVISRGRARYVGGIIIGREINTAYAQRMKGRLGGDLVFFLRGSMVANTITSAALRVLSRQYEVHRKQIARDGRSTALTIGKDDDSHNVILAPLPGEAGHHDAFYAVIGPPTPPMGLAESLRMVGEQDLAWGHYPWLLLGGGLVVILLVGLGLMVMEGDRPAQRFLLQVGELAKGELSRLDDREFSGRFGSMARSVNNALDRAEKRAAPPAKDIGRILGSPAEQGTRPDLRLDPNFSAMPPLASGVSALENLGGGMLDELQLPPARSKDGPPASAAGTIEPEEDATELQPSPPEFDSLPMSKGPAPAGAAASSFGLEPSFGPGAPEEVPSNRKIRIPESELAPPVPVRTLPPLEGEIKELPPLEAKPMADEPEQPEQPPEDEELKTYFEQVYNQFVAVKRQCGENTDNLTLDRFENKLRQNQDNLIERYKCKSVKFQVYIKDGKAAIKATPVKE